MQNRSVYQAPKKKRKRQEFFNLTEPDIPSLLSMNPSNCVNNPRLIYKDNPNQYVPFPTVPRQNVQFLPQPFLDEVCASKGWVNEVETGKLAATNCIAVFCSRKKDDGLLVAKIGYEYSFRMAQQLCFGQPIVTIASRT